MDRIRSRCWKILKKSHFMEIRRKPSKPELQLSLKIRRKNMPSVQEWSSVYFVCSWGREKKSGFPWFLQRIPTYCPNPCGALIVVINDFLCTTVPWISSGYVVLYFKWNFSSFVMVVEDLTLILLPPYFWVVITQIPVPAAPFQVVGVPWHIASAVCRLN